jgi:cellulose synthase/poly-beta-1,6-N-acetylglucosamine synthase-like glycosyltransferase
MYQQMIDFLAQHKEGVFAVGLFFIAWCVQLFYLIAYFFKVAKTKTISPANESPVSVIICARNEEKNLLEHVPLIMEQNYPSFELIIVNDSSWDDTETVLKALQLQYNRIHVVHLDEEKQNLQGKKFALTLGIKAAKHEHLLLIDADCVPSSKEWIREMTAGIRGQKDLVLGFSPYQKYKGWLNKIIRFDTLMIGMHYLGMAAAGKPYMGIGRNMAYNKELFFKVGGFKSHYSLSSGDDDLFVNQVATDKNQTVVVDPSAQTISEPKHTWKDWFIQKRRHFTTAPLYKTTDKRRLMAWPLSFLILWACFVASFFLHTGVLLLSGALFLRYVVQLTILHKVSKRLGQSGDIVWLAPFLEPHLHVLNAMLYTTNLVRKQQKWN